MQVTDFPAHLVQKLQAAEQSRSQPSNETPPGQSQGSRLTALYWNAGGMSQATFQELKLWLRQHPVDMVIVAETKWSFSSNWDDAEWNYLHSASCTSRSGGLLVMLAHTFALPAQVGFDYVDPGRIMHVRVHGDKKSFDLIAVYQYADYRNATSNQLREQVWTALDDCLSKIPVRNNLLCAGDFNSDLKLQLPWVGSTTFQWRNNSVIGSQHSDQQRLQGMLRAHGLIA